MVGPGTQRNKPHKAGRRAGRSAREKHRDKKDSAHRTSIKSSHTAHGKADRVNAAKQQRDRKRAELLEARRAVGPPCLVAVLPLSDDVDVQSLWNGLMAAFSDRQEAEDAKGTNGAAPAMEMDAEDAPVKAHPLVPLTMSLPDRRKVKFTFLPPPTAHRSDPLAAVELARAAEVVLCVLPGDARAVAVDAEGAAALTVLRAMGVPSLMALVQTPARQNATASQPSLKERSAAKKRGAEAFLAHLPGDYKVFSADTAVDFKQVLRHLADSPHALPMWRRQRPQLVAQSADFLPDPADPSLGRLVLRGFVRGTPLTAAQALHVPTAGDFQIEVIEGEPEPAPANDPDGASAMRSRGQGAAAMDAEASTAVLARCDPDAREPLVRENEPDLLDNEQTWPTEEELKEAAAAARRRVPKGTSDYQAAWILDGEDFEGDDGGEDEEGDEEESLPDAVPMADKPHGNAANARGMMEPDVGEGDGGDAWDRAETGTEVGMDYDEEEEDEEARAMGLRARRDAEGDDVQFPDEVETPMGVPARQRFARYRGLKSYRTSPWDPREDLPQDYARVFAFENFKRAHKRAKEAVSGVLAPGVGVPAGTYVSVHAAAVPAAAALAVVERVRASQSGAAPVLAAWGLLQHECKLSVVNASVRKVSGFTDPIANKEELLFVTGLRSFTARPIFSSDEHGADKHKMDRFLMDGRPSMATFFAPISYPPLPTLAFKLRPGGGVALAATGAVRDCNPDRVILKRIVLSGYPVRAHKSKAVVRWMFHAAEDVRWFRPVELWTKSGRRGRIKEPVGTHGTMKCIFDGPISQQDAVCMTLYKRAFPKWPTDLKFA